MNHIFIPGGTVTGDTYHWCEPSITTPNIITMKPPCFKAKNPCKECMYKQDCENAKE